MRRIVLVALCCSCGGADPPYVVSAKPALHATGVYPAPVWDGEGEEMKIELSFSVPMSRHGTLLLSGAETDITPEARWSSDRRALDLLVRPAFSGLRPLADDTEYSLDLAVLRDETGTPLEPGRRLVDRRLVFTTGRYDALLNHACQHTAVGPFESVAASAEKDETAPDIATTHTQYTVLLTGEGDAWWGWLRARFLAAGTYRLYFAERATVALGNGAEAELQPGAVSPTPTSCEGITHELTLATKADDEWFLMLGPHSDKTVRIIVELVPNANQGDG